MGLDGAPTPALTRMVEALKALVSFQKGSLLPSERPASPGPQARGTLSHACHALPRHGWHGHPHAIQGAAGRSGKQPDGSAKTREAKLWRHVTFLTCPPSVRAVGAQGGRNPARYHGRPCRKSGSRWGSNFASRPSKDVARLRHSGAQKAGSTFLHRCLGEHPDVFTPTGEVHFFEDPNYSERELSRLETDAKRGLTAILEGKYGVAHPAAGDILEYGLWVKHLPHLTRALRPGPASHFLPRRPFARDPRGGRVGKRLVAGRKPILSEPAAPASRNSNGRSGR